MSVPNLPELIRKLTEQYELCVSDFDGVQGFTEKLQMEAFVKILKKYANVKSDIRELAPHLLGKTAKENLKNLKEKYGLTPDLSVLLEERSKIYLDSVFETDLRPNNFMVEICRGFSLKDGPKPIIVSNGTQKTIQSILEHWEMREVFGPIYSSDTFPNAHLPLNQRKVDFILNYLPKIYNLMPHQIIIFEDSVSVSRQVQAAGMGVGFVRHALNESFCPETGIILECDSLNESFWP